MSENRQNIAIGQYNDLICKLPGVMSANVVVSGEDISEIHILADIRRAPKQIARDVQSAIMAQFGVDVDHKLISIAQIPAQAHPKLRGRLVFEEICTSKNKERSSATVTLSDGETTYSGTAAALNDRLEVNRMICQATLSAVENFIEDSVLLSVADVKAFDLGGERAVAVSVAIKTGSRVERVIGSAFAGDDGSTAVVRATMDALNRKIANA